MPDMDAPYWQFKVFADHREGYIVIGVSKDGDEINEDCFTLERTMAERIARSMEHAYNAGKSEIVKKCTSFLKKSC